MRDDQDEEIYPDPALDDVVVVVDAHSQTHPAPGGTRRRVVDDKGGLVKMMWKIRQLVSVNEHRMR